MAAEAPCAVESITLRQNAESTPKEEIGDYRYVFLHFGKVHARTGTMRAVALYRYFA